MFGRNNFVYAELSIRRVIGITVTVYLTVQILKGAVLAASPYLNKLTKKLQDKADNLG